MPFSYNCVILVRKQKKMKLSIFKISFVVGLYKSTQCKNTLLQNRVADLETILSFLAAWLVNLLKIWMARILSK